MNLTIVVADNAVTKDGVGHGGLDLSTCSIPADVWALQWNGTSGHIEFYSESENTEIDELPSWATAAEAKWQVAKDAEVVEEDGYTGEDDPELDALMAVYPPLTYAYADLVIGKTSSNDFTVQKVSGTWAYNMEVQETTPYKPIGLAVTNVAGNGAAILNKMGFLAEEAAKYGIPIFSSVPQDYPNQEQIVQYNLDHMGQLKYQYENRSYMYTPWNTDKEKLKKDKDINLDRANALEAGFVWEGNTYDADNLSRTNLAGYVAMVDASINLPANFTWRDMDNNNVPITEETIKSFATAMNTFMNQCYVTSWERKAALDAATDIEEIRAV